jgi:hypothetical protein
MRAPFAANPTAGQIHFTWTAGNTGGDTITITGREIVLAWNSGASPYTVGVTSQIDGQNRTGDISAYSLAAGEFAYVSAGLTNAPGWKNQSTGLLTITPSNAAVKWAVLQLPVGYPG